VAVLSPDVGCSPMPRPPSRPSLHDLHADAARDILARRLDHIEHAARKVARLAARPAIEDV